MEPNNKEVLSAAPPVEALGQKERLINKEATGAQVLWLLGINPNTTAENIINDKYDKDKLKESVEKGIPQAHKDKINKASFNEREEYWENKKDIKAEDRMKEWEKGMNAFLDPIKEDQTKVTFLKNILKKDGEDPNNVTINAKNIYDTFMRGQGNGDVQFFVKSIVDNNEFGDIEKNQDLIRNLGKIYGDNSAKISELLTHGMANVKYKENEFFVSAQENLNQKNYGDPEIWNTLDKNSGSWDEKQAKIKEAERIAAEAVVEKKKQEEEAKKKENEKKTPVIRSLEKDKDEVEDAYNIVANQDAEKIKEEWNGHQKLTISALNEPVVIDEEVIRDYNELVAQYAIKENKEVPFFFVEDTENKRIVKIFVGEAKSYGSTELSPITAKAKDGEIFADWWNGENNKKNLFNGKDGRFKVGMGHTHPKGYGPMFSNVGEGDFGLDYSSEFEFRSSALFAANPCASNISFVGSPEMGLIGAFEVQNDGKITFRPVKISELKEQESSSQEKDLDEKIEELSEREPEAIKELSERMNKSSSELIKKSIPLLKTLEKKPDGISDEDYGLLTKRAFYSFTRAEEFEKAGKGKEQQVNEILVFYDEFNKLHDLTTLIFPKKYYEERLNEFETILKEEGIEKIKVEADKDFNSDMMNDISVPVEDEAKVGKVLEIVASGFTIDKKLLRKALVKVGAQKEIAG